MAGVVGSISIRDRASSVLKNIRTEQGKLRKDAKETSKTLKSAWDAPHKVKLFVKDGATAVLKKTGSGLKALGRMTVKPTVGLLDKASGGIKKIAGSLAGLSKKLVIPVAAAAAAGTLALGGSVSAGMQLEQQQISIEHFVGATNKSLSQDEVKAQAKSYIASLRENANATPFETGEVIEAGSRAVSLAGGDTSAAMQMVTLAEDMAAASGGTKSIMDAMEALGDLKVGETERLKEFGFKVSAEEFKKKGVAGVSGELTDFYGGAAGKLAGSGAGLLSTITGKLKSNAADFGLGVVEQLKPVLSDVIGLIDEAQPALETFSAAFGSSLSKGLGFAKGAFAELKPFLSDTLSAVGPLAESAFGALGTAAQQAAPVLGSIAQQIGPAFAQAQPVVEAAVSGISSAFGKIAPVVGPIVTGIAGKVGSFVGVLSKHSATIEAVVSTAGGAIAEVLSAAWSVAGPILDAIIAAFDLVLTATERAWPKVSSVIEGAWKRIKSVFDAIAKAADWVGGAISKVTGAISGGNDKSAGKGDSSGKPGKNARGTDNWRGGPTWVGEDGPELLELPRGTRILPSKQSAALAGAGGFSEEKRGVRRPESGTKVLRMSSDTMARRTGIASAARSTLTLSPKILPLKQSVLSAVGAGQGRAADVLELRGQRSLSAAPSSNSKTYNITITKLADNVTMRSEADANELAEKTAKKIIEALDNTA